MIRLIYACGNSKAWNAVRGGKRNSDVSQYGGE